jgi:hypothetical protein
VPLVLATGAGAHCAEVDRHHGVLRHAGFDVPRAVLFVPTFFVVGSGSRTG